MVESAVGVAATVEVMTTTVGFSPGPVGVEVMRMVETSVVGGGAEAVTTLVVLGTAEGEGAGCEEAGGEEAGAGSADEEAGGGALEAGSRATDEVAGGGGGLEAAGGMAEAALDEGEGAAAAVAGGDGEGADGGEEGDGGEDATGEDASAGNVLAVALLDMAAVGRHPGQQQSAQAQEGERRWRRR